ncbi:MAG: hypothetical protein LBF97_07170 [Elusimicrobiota bacterium]|jgi:acetyl-CoA carboxylase biotin carboxyl carrier protein|nr:hypothetical protein [Elusimicrobiota bacterium]
MDVKRIENFFELLKDTDIKELCWESNGLKLRIKRNFQNENFKCGKSADNINNIAENVNTKSDLNNVTKEYINSKFVGTFKYSNVKFKKIDIKIGDKISKYQVLGYIEAMNIFKEVTSDYEGILSEIFVESGDKIEYGQKLFSLEIK